MAITASNNVDISWVENLKSEIRKVSYVYEHFDEVACRRTHGNTIACPWKINPGSEPP